MCERELQGERREKESCDVEPKVSPPLSLEGLVTCMPSPHQWLVERHNLSMARPSPPAEQVTSPPERATSPERTPPERTTSPARAVSPTPDQASAAPTPTNFHSTGERSRERSEPPPPRAPSPEGVSRDCLPKPSPQAELDRAGECAQGGGGFGTDVQRGQEIAAVDGHDLAKGRVLAGGNKKCDSKGAGVEGSSNSHGARPVHLITGDGKGKFAPPVARNAPAAELLPLFSSLSRGSPPRPARETLILKL